ncbi:sushi, von Willebrand factor type A, EGF and pentraxin domain-containing protein 1-like [Gigantopelta aegis]|uniref:sushi, von Willebrand factor type A, EGF and pentraxin domain-containing protein 1-like n=1 Tax=Gigantopelta aegis TaxID=1735272 RepID=UPI001B888890|nr:sushi, von Willebrand factor type A, EGF and pentraxin domain-containing protein 1-like [Gigantopelta aegis]
MSSETALLGFGLITLAHGFSLDNFGQRSRQLMGSEFLTETVKNFLQCKNLCDRRSLCKSVNYNPKTKECTANFHDSQTSSTPLDPTFPEVLFAEKRSMPKGIDVCDSGPCENTQVCTRMGSHPVCFTEEIRCGVAPNVPYASKTSPRLSAHSVSTYSCNAGYTVSSGETTSTCDVTRRWTPTNLTCVA